LPMLVTSNFQLSLIFETRGGAYRKNRKYYTRVDVTAVSITSIKSLIVEATILLSEAISQHLKRLVYSLKLVEMFPSVHTLAVTKTQWLIY